MKSANGSYATKDELAHSRVDDYPLSNGKKAKVRRATLSMLIADGRIPNPLRPLVLSIESGARAKSLEQHPESLSQADLEEFESLRDEVISQCLIEPELTPAEVREYLNPDDRDGLFDFAIHVDVMARLSRFRQQLGVGVEGAGNGGGAGSG